MDNTIIPYTDNSDISSEELDDSDENDEYSHILSNNIGIHYNKFVTSGDFMNMENQKEYECIRNKYFTPEIRKIRLLIESKNITYTSDRNTSNYKVHFENNDTNSTGGYGNFDNVIGFRLIKANVFNSIYNVNNNNLNLKINGSSVVLDQGSYTFNELGNHLQTKLNTTLSPSVFTVVSNNTTYKYDITISSGTFTMNWNDADGYAYRLFGFNNTSYSGSSTYTSDNVVQQSSQFVDLVIPEIPYIACKRNSIGKHLIDRIPLDCEQGSIMYYSSDINLENYFTPININSLNIQLYEDTTDILYDCQNNDNSFEFELTILNRGG
tara:strand:+ start:22 stop:993 length:972 start_codon:yes stop_codon:yes gene_type:complete